MSRYYVIADNGQKYGPCDENTLMQWANEKRLVPTTLLEDENGVQKQAQNVISFASQPNGQSPQGNYNQSGKIDLTNGNLGVNNTPNPNSYAGNNSPQYSPYNMNNQNMGENNSGMGPMSILPPDLQGLNWGAFFLNIFWAISNKTYIGLLCLVPYLGWIMCIVLLIKGNEWAWQNRRFYGKEDFREVQKAWSIWGIVIFAVSFIITIFSYGTLAAIFLSGLPFN